METDYVINWIIDVIMDKGDDNKKQEEKEPGAYIDDGWERFAMSDGVQFFVKASTREIVWIPDRKSAEPTVVIEKRKDSRGRTYYVNHKTRTTQWGLPETDCPLEERKDPKTGNTYYVNRTGFTPTFAEP